MDNRHLILNANLIVAALEKPSAEFTKADMTSVWSTLCILVETGS